MEGNSKKSFKAITIYGTM